MRDYVVLDIETSAIADAEQYLEPVEPPANYKDPAKIAEYLAAAQAKALERCGLDPALCTVAALGWQMVGEPTPQVRVCQTTTDERDTLEYFWRDVGDAVLVTFNGLRFDLPVLMMRSMLLGVKYPALSLDKYRSPHIDLFNRLTFNGAISGHSLKFYLSRFGIPSDDLVTGKDVPALIKAGQWDAVRAHCEADVIGTYKLAERIGAIQRQAVAV